MFSGHYVGDLCRLVLKDLCEKSIVFQKSALDALEKWDCIRAKHISNIEK